MSDEEAIEKYSILPRPLADRDGGRVETKSTFLGLALTSGAREEVISFANDCLCCTFRGDLLETLGKLVARSTLMSPGLPTSRRPWVP